MTRGEAIAVLDGPVNADVHPSGRACGVCGVPQQIWWTDDQLAAHRRFHRALAVLVGGVGQ